MSDKSLLKITPMILIHQSTSTTNKRNGISQSLSVFSNKMKYKYPSLQKVNCCFDKGTVQSNYKSLSNKYIKLCHCTLMIDNYQTHCRYKRLPPLFHLPPRDSSLSKNKSLKILFNSHLDNRYLPDNDALSNPLISIKEKLSNSSKEMKVRNMKDKMLNIENISHKGLIQLRSFWVTNDKRNKDRKKFIPKYSCIYSRKDQKSLNYSVLFPVKNWLSQKAIKVNICS